jgi:hypothetical protein
VKRPNVDAVGNDLPVSPEVLRDRLHHRLADGDPRRDAIEAGLEEATKEPVKGRVGEPGVRGGHDWQAETPGSGASDQSLRGREDVLHVYEVDALVTQDVRDAAGQRPPGGEAGKGSVAVDSAALPDAADVRGVAPLAAHVAGDHDGLMPPRVQLLREVVHVLGHAPEVGIVVFADQGDPHGVCAPS